MRTIAIASVLLASALGCGAAPNQPLLANAPRPDPGAVAGIAAGAAAAITLADPDAASRRPEKKQDAEKKPIKVKESVPSDVLDRQASARPDDSASSDQDQPAGPDNVVHEHPSDALDFGTLRLPPGAKPAKASAHPRARTTDSDNVTESAATGVAGPGHLGAPRLLLDAVQ